MLLTATRFTVNVFLLFTVQQELADGVALTIVVIVALVAL